jgi:hypothetical protein
MPPKQNTVDYPYLCSLQVLDSRFSTGLVRPTAFPRTVLRSCHEQLNPRAHSLPSRSQPPAELENESLRGLARITAALGVRSTYSQTYVKHRHLQVAHPSTRGLPSSDATAWPLRACAAATHDSNRTDLASLHDRWHATPSREAYSGDHARRSFPYCSKHPKGHLSSLSQASRPPLRPYRPRSRSANALACRRWMGLCPLVIRASLLGFEMTSGGCHPGQTLSRFPGPC